MIDIDYFSYYKKGNDIKKYTKKDIHIFVCGGEPTVYPYLTDLLNTVVKSFNDNDYIEIQSNLGMSYNKLTKFINKIDCIDKIKISASYHNTQCKNYPSFIKKCLYLKNLEMLKMISYGYNSKKNVIKDFELGLKVIGEEHCEIVPLINASVDQDLSKGNKTYKEIDFLNEFEQVNTWKDHSHFFDNQLKYTLKTGKEYTTNRNEMWKNRSNNFLGTKCSIPKWKIYIDWDGNAYKCFNEQFSPLQPVFNINEDYDLTKDSLVDDYEHILEDNKITHIVEYSRDTQDFNIGYELGYLRALEITADRFTEIEKELN